VFGVAKALTASVRRVLLLLIDCSRPISLFSMRHPRWNALLFEGGSLDLRFSGASLRLIAGVRMT
jgi:hypothetical protein